MGVRGSYEIEFIGEKWVAGILKEAMRMGNVEVEESDNGFRIRLNGARKRITVVCNGCAERNGGNVILNSRKLPESGGIVLNASRIAKECGSKPEIAMLGALAKLGVVDLKNLMGVVYKKLGYCDALAVKKGFEAARF